MFNREDSATKAREFLEKNLEARICDDPEWRYTLIEPMSARYMHDQATIDDIPELMAKKTVVPAIKIVLHPVQYERLLGILSYIVDKEQRDSLSYRTPQEMQAYDVLMEKAWEKRLSDNHPTVKAAYEQYMTAIKLCS